MKKYKPRQICLRPTTAGWSVLKGSSPLNQVVSGSSSFEFSEPSWPLVQHVPLESIPEKRQKVPLNIKRRNRRKKCRPPAREVVATYAAVQEQIIDAISSSPADSFLCTSLEDIQKTMRSMEPMIYDMELSESVEASHHHKFTDRFFPLLEEVEAFLCSLPQIEPPTLHPRARFITRISDKNKLDRIQRGLKNLFERYVLNELEELATADEQVADDNDVVLRRLLTYLGLKFRNQVSRSSKPVFRKIDIILDFLETEFDKRRQRSKSTHPAPYSPKVLLLLNEVKLLLRFLDGDHGLDIPKYLLTREKGLRKFVTDDKVLAQLKELDHQEENQERYMTMVVILLGLLGLLASLLSTRKPDIGMVIAVASIIFIVAGSLAFKWISSEYTAPLKSKTPCKLKKCEIFLNFRGSRHMRYTVVGVFHNNLEKANICTFFDERGWLHTKHITEEIESAICTSVGAVTIFSEDYGESEYCLDELHLIAKRRKAYKPYILSPIFYDVTPDDIPKPKPKPKDLSKPKDLPKPESKFRLGLEKTYGTNGGKVKSWEDALTYVVGIGGEVHKSDRDHLDKLVDRVVEVIKTQLQK